MGEVVQLFPDRTRHLSSAEIPDFLKELDARLKLIRRIRYKEEAIQFYQEIIKGPTTLMELRLAKSLLCSAQQELDILVAQYTGTYGALES